MKLILLCAAIVLFYAVPVYAEHPNCDDQLNQMFSRYDVMKSSRDRTEFMLSEVLVELKRVREELAQAKKSTKKE